MSLSLTINDLDVWQYCQPNWSISQQLSRQGARFTCTLIANAGTIGAVITPLATVVFTDTTVGELFRGMLVQRKRFFPGAPSDIRYGWELTCVDYTLYLDTRVVDGEYTAQPLRYIVNDLLTNFGCGVTLTPAYPMQGIDNGPNITISLGIQSLSQALTRLCEYASDTGGTYHWLVTTNGKLRVFNDSGAYLAASYLSDDVADADGVATWASPPTGVPGYPVGWPASENQYSATPPTVTVARYRRDADASSFYDFLDAASLRTRIYQRGATGGSGQSWEDDFLWVGTSTDLGQAAGFSMPEAPFILSFTPDLSPEGLAAMQIRIYCQNPGSGWTHNDWITNAIEPTSGRYWLIELVTDQNYNPDSTIPAPADQVAAGRTNNGPCFLLAQDAGTGQARIIRNQAPAPATREMLNVAYRIGGAYSAMFVIEDANAVTQYDGPNGGYFDVVLQDNSEPDAAMSAQRAERELQNYALAETRYHIQTNPAADGVHFAAGQKTWLTNSPLGLTHLPVLVIGCTITGHPLGRRSYALDLVAV